MRSLLIIVLSYASLFHQTRVCNFILSHVNHESLNDHTVLYPFVHPLILEWFHIILYSIKMPHSADKHNKTAAAAAVIQLSLHHLVLPPTSLSAIFVAITVNQCCQHCNCHCNSCCHHLAAVIAIIVSNSYLYSHCVFYRHHHCQAQWSGKW